MSPKIEIGTPSSDGDEADSFRPSVASQFPKVPTENNSEEVRARLAEKCKNDLFFLTSFVLGYSDLNKEVHLPMCRFCEMDDYHRRMMLMPRTHFKTTIWTIADSIRLIIRDPNIRLLMVADTEANASRFLKEIQLHFEQNELFRWIFQEIIPDNFKTTVWNKTEMLVKRDKIAREPTIDAIGALGGSESRHYDRIKADDLITEKAVRSVTEMDKIIKWSGGLESLLVHLIDGYIDFIGSRKKFHDLYGFVRKKFGGDGDEIVIGPHAFFIGDLAVFTRQVRNPDGQPIFAERVSNKFLVRLEQFDPERYHAQYVNSPKGTGLDNFETQMLGTWEWLNETEIVCIRDGEELLRVSPFTMDRIIFYDPSRAEKQTSSRNAIHVVAKGSHPFRLVLESYIGHYSPDEAVDLLFELNSKWRCDVVSIESRGYQGSIKFWLNEKTERESLPSLPVIEWPLEGSFKAQWAKEEHIRGMQPIVKAGFMWLHETHTELREEFEYYPNHRWDDGLDSLTQGLDYWPMSFDDLDIMERKDAEYSYLKSQGMDLEAGMLGVNRHSNQPWDEQAFVNSFDHTGYGFRNA